MKVGQKRHGEIWKAGVQPLPLHADSLRRAPRTVAACVHRHPCHSLHGRGQQASSVLQQSPLYLFLDVLQGKQYCGKEHQQFLQAIGVIEGEGNDRQVPIALLVLAGFQLVLHFFHLIPDSLSTSSADVPRFQAHYIKQRQQHLFILFMGFSRQEC